MRYYSVSSVRLIMYTPSHLYTYWLSLLLVILGYLCNLQANAILLNNLTLDGFGDFSCAWRSLSLFAQIMLIGSRYTRCHYDKRSITPSFLLSHRPLITRSFIVMLTVYCLFWLFTLHANRHDFSQLSNYHLIYFTFIFAILQTCVIVLERFIAILGFTFYAHFSSSFLHYLIKLVVIAVGFQLYQPTSIPELAALIAAFLILMALCDVLSIKILTRNTPNTLCTRHPVKSQNYSTYPLTWYNLVKDPAVSTVVGLMSSYAPIYLIEILSPYEHLVGLYSLCMILISFIEPLLVRVSEPVHNILLSSASKESRSHKKFIEDKLSNIAAVRLLLILITYLLYYSFADQIFSTFSVYGFNDKRLVALMLVVVYLEDVVRQRETFLYSHSQTSSCLWVNCLSLCLMITLGAYLIGPFSLTGIVAANIISQLLRLAFVSYRCAQLSNIRFSLLW